MTMESVWISLMFVMTTTIVETIVMNKNAVSRLIVPCVAESKGLPVLYSHI